MKAGGFREDLYYRLHVVPLELPPLRERDGDIKIMLEEMTSRFARMHGLEPPVISDETMNVLLRYPWPGNVRELRNLCERLVVLFSGRVVEPGNLPSEFQSGVDNGLLSKGLLWLLESGVRMDELEEQLIRHALAKTGGNRSRAARLLGLTRDTLLYRIKKHAIS